MPIDADFLNGPEAFVQRPCELFNMRVLYHAVMLARYEVDIDVARQLLPSAIGCGGDRHRRVARPHQRDSFGIGLNSVLAGQLQMRLE